jgi:vacuolar-type H+-ATPase subunit H
MKKPQENIEKSGNSISIEKIDILSGTKKDIEEILLSIKDIYPDILII